MYRSARPLHLLFDQHAVFDRPDDRRGPGQQEMDGRSQHSEQSRSAQQLWGFRKNCPNPEVALHYRARPLNGVWATAPYLHNGSVPSLYWMLMPAAQRPKQFCMGFRDFDPQQVGFRVEADEVPKCRNGETLFSATARDGTPIARQQQSRPLARGTAR